MKTKATITMLLTLALCFGTVSNTMAKGAKESAKTEKKALYQKKYTNKDYYTNGQFNKEVAMKAMKDMFAFYGVPFTKFMAENMWVTDFGLGDFENIGMGGIFYVNDAEHNVFGHEIYLLPNQMIAEHCHVASDYPAKHEAGLVRYGGGYNFCIGEPTPNAPKLPESQKNFITLKHFDVKKAGDMVYLSKIETKHFLYAGPHGMIVTEFGTFHDNAGLRFSNPGVKF